MRYVLAAFILALVGCATGDANLREVNYSLGEIKQVIASVAGAPRSYSENGRTYLSQYFGLKSDKKFDPQKSKKRLYAKVTVLGDRPYDVAVDVVIEQKNGGQYDEVGTDEAKAAQFAKEIEDRLHKGIENRNVIDDFRAF